MKLSFHGAAREVTGSCHLVEHHGKRLLLDCGMFQGGAERHDRNRAPFPFAASEIDAVVLSHAHIDHSGRLPLLVRAGFRGPIYCTAPTADLTEILLEDSARIHEEDARWKIKRLRKRHEPYDWVTPLYTLEEARAVFRHFKPQQFERPRAIDEIGRLRFVPAGHILGAAIVELALDGVNGGPGPRLVFSGDFGPDGSRLLASPQTVPAPDVLVMESTYGDRSRENHGDLTEQLLEVVQATAKRGGRVVIPAFAVGRTQALLARLNDLVEHGRLKNTPVFVDSPMATAATKVFAMHPEAYSEEARRSVNAGDKPLDFPGLRFSQSVEESKAIADCKEPCIVISASGMCTAGRIKHHLAHSISDPRHTVLFVGYQAKGTLGQAIQSGVTPVRIFGDAYPVRAKIETIEGFSAHADREELLTWFGALGGPPARTFVVHGEETAALAMVEALEARGAKAMAPTLEQAVSV